MGWRHLTERVHAAATNAAVMGELVSVTPAVGAPFEVHGIFSGTHEAVLANTDTPVSTTVPVVTLRESDLPAELVEGDRLSIRGQLYAAVDFQPDGQGAVKVVLNEVSA